MSVTGLITNGDGTVTDSVTGLMWTANTITGTYTWEEATAKFGKGRYIQEENAPKEISVSTYSKYKGFTSYLGHDDWRLPTVEELRTLTDSFANIRRGTEMKEVFQSSSTKSVWSANDAGFVAIRYSGAWCLFNGHGICEMPVEEKYSIRLVREGNVYNSIDRNSAGGCRPAATAIFIVTISALLLFAILIWN